MHLSSSHQTSLSLLLYCLSFFFSLTFTSPLDGPYLPLYISLITFSNSSYLISCQTKTFSIYRHFFSFPIFIINVYSYSLVLVVIEHFKPLVLYQGQERFLVFLIFFWKQPKDINLLLLNFEDV